MSSGTSPTSPVYANGEDIALITCYALDDAGREVPDASGMVRFSCIGGRIVGTGSDESDHAPATLPDRMMYAGLVSVAVRVGDKPGNITLLAESDHLKRASIMITVEDAKAALETSKANAPRIEVLIAGN